MKLLFRTGLRNSHFPLPEVSKKKNVLEKLNRSCSYPSGKLFAMCVLIVVLVIRQTGNIINWFLFTLCVLNSFIIIHNNGNEALPEVQCINL